MAWSPNAGRLLPGRRSKIECLPCRTPPGARVLQTDRPVMNTLIWLRTDLRLHDNPALAAAAANGTATALFIAAPGQ